MSVYTSLELSKKLEENGCNLTHYASWAGSEEGEYWIHSISTSYAGVNILAPAYDLIRDVCVKYAKEFFGDDSCCCIYWPDTDISEVRGVSVHVAHLHIMLMNGDHKKAEEYIRSHCKFNPANKDETKGEASST